jgi:hypothetical protein
LNQQTAKLTYDEIDKLLEVFDFDVNRSKEINMKFVTEEELDTLLKTH